MHTIENAKEGGAMTVELCPRCGFHPVSPRAEGYCSWDCYDADDEEDDTEEGQADEGGDGSAEAAA